MPRSGILKIAFEGLGVDIQNNFARVTKSFPIQEAQ